MGSEKKSFAALFEAAQAQEEYWTEQVIHEFTEELAHCMELRKISRAELAAAIGCSQPYITKILKGNVNFTLATMVKLSRAVGASLRLSLETESDRNRRAPLQATAKERSIAKRVEKKGRAAQRKGAGLSL